MTLEQHLDPAITPKRILALDGGGVRGVLTLQYLERIETMLRERYGKPDLVLADYFDLIGGTSTGAIIAAALALGIPVAEIQSLYRDLASMIFKRSWFRLGAIVPKFTSQGLQRALEETYGADTRLSSERLNTGLLIVTKRMDTGSTWPLTNHPRDPYYAPQLGKRRIGHANMLLWQVVRASTAAPHYFGPERIAVGSAILPSGEVQVDDGQFVDGGISTANNPSIQLMKVALLKGFAFNWQPGEDKVLLVSVGTAARYRKRGHAKGLAATAGAFAAKALLSIMDDCADDVETMMQWISRSPTARSINGQIQKLDGELLTPEPLLTYIRYNVQLERAWVKSQLDLDMDQASLDTLARMDRPQNMQRLTELGAAAAQKQVLPEHLPAAFDLPRASAAALERHGLPGQLTGRIPPESVTFRSPREHGSS